VTAVVTAGLPPLPDDAADLERRFGGLRRLWGDAGYARVRAATVAVVGVGGVGSWAAEALARSGVAGLVLIDLDQVSESNINRQVQALGSTVGRAKVDALAQRIADIHPGCRLQGIEEFVEPGNWPGLLPGAVDVLIDACDQTAAKHLLARWGLTAGVPVVTVGAAGGKSRPELVATADLADVTHDPLLGRLRRQLRSEGAARTGALGLTCVYSRESVSLPPAGSGTDGSLNCHGYGSSVTVTAVFGMVAAAEALRLLRTSSDSSAPGG
jgi:tRNA threonylcarbamoyladenosine dehydratase